MNRQQTNMSEINAAKTKLKKLGEELLQLDKYGTEKRALFPEKPHYVILGIIFLIFAPLAMVINTFTLKIEAFLPNIREFVERTNVRPAILLYIERFRTSYPAVSTGVGIVTEIIFWGVASVMIVILLGIGAVRAVECLSTAYSDNGVLLAVSIIPPGWVIPICIAAFGLALPFICIGLPCVLLLIIATLFLLLHPVALLILIIVLCIIASKIYTLVLTKDEEQYEQKRSKLVMEINCQADWLSEHTVPAPQYRQITDEPPAEMRGRTNPLPGYTALIQQNEIVQAPYEGICIAGFALSFVFPLPVGLIVSIIGAGRAKANGTRGRGLAIAGIIISAVFSVIILVEFAAMLLIVYSSISSGYSV